MHCGLMINMHDASEKKKTNKLQARNPEYWFVGPYE